MKTSQGKSRKTFAKVYPKQDDIARGILGLISEYEKVYCYKETQYARHLYMCEYTETVTWPLS